MTQKEKELLLKDICARLPYGFTLYRESDDCIITIKPGDISTFSHFLEYSESEDFKPYLRPMSSMTEEEEKEFCNFEFTKSLKGFLYMINNYEQIDWLNVHHFDYRCLIEKGLALEAPEGMYDKQ